jgi:hypothetical protein
MDQLESLLARFSDTPRHVVVKADVTRRGVRPTEDLQAASATSCTTGLTTKWSRSLGQPEPPPSQFHFLDDDTTVDIRPQESSPYAIRRDEAGRHHLLCGDQVLDEIYFTPRPAYMDLRLSNGEPVSDYLTQRGPSCLCVDVTNFCAFVKKGDACQYCLLGPAMELSLRQKLTRPVPDYELVAEAVAIAADELDLRELKLSGGGFYDTRKEARFHQDCLETLLSRIPAPEEVTVFSQALERDDQLRLKELGATNICFDLEVWDEELWPKVLPGKAKAVGRAEWMRRLEIAVELFGRGHVGSNFVAGFECAPRDGFLTRSEALASYKRGFADVIERGIVPWFTIWTTMPLVGGFQADDPPTTDFYLELGPVIHELLEKHGVYKDLGFSELGVDPETLGLYCYYCYSMQFTHDYPRLIGRKSTEPTA